VEYAAIWVSQQTQDFYHKMNSMTAWNEYHGANELCPAPAPKEKAGQMQPNRVHPGA